MYLSQGLLFLFLFFIFFIFFLFLAKVTWRMQLEKQELLTILKHMIHPSFYVDFTLRDLVFSVYFFVDHCTFVLLVLAIPLPVFPRFTSYLFHIFIFFFTR